MEPNQNPQGNTALVVAVILILVFGVVVFALMSRASRPVENQVTESESVNEAMTGEDQPESTQTPSPDDSMMEEKKADDSTMMEQKTFVLDGVDFSFKPNEIRVKKGDKVKVVLNSLDMPHDFVVDELNVKSSIAQAGETTSVEFTADKVGEFEFYCSVGQHRARGMVGKLIVE